VDCEDAIFGIFNGIVVVRAERPAKGLASLLADGSGAIAVVGGSSAEVENVVVGTLGIVIGDEGRQAPFSASPG